MARTVATRLNYGRETLFLAMAMVIENDESASALSGEPYIAVVPGGSNSKN